MPVILATDIIILLLLSREYVWAVLFGRKSWSLFKALWAALKKNRLAMASLVVLALYASIVGILDSIRWREPGRTDD